MPTQKMSDRANKINCTEAQLDKVYNQFNNIKYRCGKGRYNNAKFLLGDFDTFIEWIASQGGYKTSPHGHAYHVSRIRDQGDYEYGNIRWCSHQENLRETANFYLVSDLSTSRQELFQGNLAEKLKELFNVEATSGAYAASKTGNLYLGRFKIDKLSI
ncbi:hypothetical protein [Vibrio cholerae]|uniref:hypothetical protein n=1 Tax=Vibrio cholerae TaxID=666 RepID=UPI0022712D06|nr:hypothetical protein [Vibrio cholerae]MCX9483741.1 hypothetical protein [Vibrio cholerae]